MVYSMLHEDPGKVTFDDVGGLDDEIRVLREVIQKSLKIMKIKKIAN